uniref:Rho GTPase activating protein 27, like n=1 Tax=Gouania willdenowi TaxID=441366 RepID=A0A8C5EE84_GOUWI
MIELEAKRRSVCCDSAGLGLVLVEYEYQYEGRDGLLVSIKPNERYVLLSKTNAHWWQVRSDAGSKSFYIPAKYVKELPADFPSLLDFSDQPAPEPVPLPLPAQTPVPVSVPKLDESRTRAGDQVTIRVRPDTATRYRRNENRMSTFGVLLDVHEPPRHSTNESVADGLQDDHRDSGKSRVPSFSPADPLPGPRTHSQPIPVEMPVVPPLASILVQSSSTSEPHDNQQPMTEPEEAELSTEGSAEEEKDKESHHIYESIQDLNLDLKALFCRSPNLVITSCSQMLEKAGILNKTKVAENGKRIRKNWSQSWTVLHGGILTFHRDPKSAPAGNASKSSQIVPEFTVELRGSSLGWAAKDKSSKKNVLELRTRQGCEFLMQYDTESIICDWLKVIQDTIRQLDHLSEDDEDSDKDDTERRKTSNRNSSSGNDSEQRRVRNKLRRFLQRRPTLQSVKEKGYIRDNVFGCHLDTLCHRENSTIPKFVEKCIRTVERRGLDIDGIYRVSGNLAVIQKLRHKADHEEQLDLEDGQWEEIHVITGALKLFLRELPEPLFPFSSFNKFITAIQDPDYTQRVSYIKALVQTLPLPNHDTMELLFRHLRRVIEHRDSNRMSVQGMSIVFGPTLLRPQTESANMTMNMVFQSQIVELLLNEFLVIFPQS